MSFHVPNAQRNRVCPRLGTDDSAGNNGAFHLRSCQPPRVLNIIASDGEGWEHVSVSIDQDPKKTPTWAEMCQVKAMFWDAEDVVVQFHPAKSEYRNHHPGCLHMWRPTYVVIPTPDPLMVAP